MKIIAVVGMTGAGKSELAAFFERAGYTKIRFGDITEELLRKKGQDVNEENEKRLRESLRKEYGMDAYAKLNLDKIASSKRDVVIDGLYSWEEYLLLRQKFNRDLVVLAVFSPPETRYERLADREVRGLTKEQARQRDMHEISVLNKTPPIAMADYTITNVGTLHDLESSFEKFLEWHREADER